MPRRFSPVWVPSLALRVGVALLGLVSLVPPAARAETKTTPPAVVVRLESIDNLVADFKYLAALSDRDELVKQFAGLLKTKTGPNGIEGIDPKRPLGLYGNIGNGAFPSDIIVLVPVADEKAFLNLLKTLNLKPDKGEGDVYNVEVPNVPVAGHLRFANDYAYLTIGAVALLDKDKLLSPAKVLPADQVGAISVNVRIDLIPDGLRQLALGQIALRLADVRDRDYQGKTKAEKEFWRQAFDDLGKEINAVVRDGEELSVRVDVDRKAGDLVADVNLTGKSGSKLAAQINDLGQSRSAVAGVLGEGAALQGLLTFSLPPDLRDALATVVDDGLAKALEKETDKNRREHAEAFLKTLEPTLKSGTFDGVAVLRAPAENNKYHTLVLGLKVKDGAALEQGVRDLVKVLPAGDREKIKLDADKVGDVAIHQAENSRIDEKGRKVFGDNPVYFAVTSDALLLALGDNGLNAIKEAVAVQPSTAAPLRFEASLKRLAPAIALDRKDTGGKVKKAAEEAFKEKDDDRVRLTINGGRALKVHADLKAQVLKFLSLLDKSEDKEEK